jgi:hypothetical protein
MSCCASKIPTLFDVALKSVSLEVRLARMSLTVKGKFIKMILGTSYYMNEYFSYSPSPEYLAAWSRDERQGEPR